MVVRPLPSCGFRGVVALPHAAADEHSVDRAGIALLLKMVFFAISLGSCFVLRDDAGGVRAKTMRTSTPSSNAPDVSYDYLRARLTVDAKLWNIAGLPIG